MALTGVLRPGFCQLRVLDMEASLRHYVDLLGMTLVSREADGRAYLKARNEFDRHSVVLRPAATAGIDVFAFKVDGARSLADFVRRIDAWGLAVDWVPAGEQPGVGERVGFTVPSGHRFELYHQIDIAEVAPQTQNPYIWNPVPKGVDVLRMDHGLFYGPDIEKNLDFFVDVLDFKLTESVEAPDQIVAVFLSCSTKAHDIAFVRHPEPGKLHHISFLVKDWSAIGHAADMMVHTDTPIDIGPTRHGITQGQTIYFFDPSGNRNETFAGDFTFYPDYPRKVWDASEIGRAIFYYERALNERFLTVVT